VGTGYKGETNIAASAVSFDILPSVPVAFPILSDQF
jgi:hypothetical protein